ncbi:MAG TPA: sensor domain-containing diguanylate cyclase, partial [Dehalococcoidia bacterium]|nr:sensor domain-containing diguanylate cyclase [Dehalococcoidia bacterium]
LRPGPVAILALAAIISGAVVVVLAVSFQIVIDEQSGDIARDTRALSAASEVNTASDKLLALGLNSSLQGTLAPDAHGQLPLNDALAAHAYVERIGMAARRLARLDPRPSSLAMQDSAGALSNAFVLYLVYVTPETYTDLLTQVRAVDSAAAAEVTSRQDAVLAAQTALRSRTRISSDLIIAAALIAAVVTSTAAWLIGRRLRNSITSIEAEKRALVDANRALGRRNQQFAALYQIVTEVTETLSLTYVVRTTVREARKLVGAEAVVLRLLEKGDLAVVGAEADDPDAAPPAPSIPLGVGVQGRAAKRGRTVRLDESTDAVMMPGECPEGTRSGVVVPLIVGARVIGTLACWSRTPALFDADDERALELMASQVSTAIAAADMHEKTEQAALHDALTGVPNRRQLSVDLEGDLAAYIERQRPTAVGMLDIDHFKRFNDEFGHRVGDVTLQRVAEIIKISVRDSDHVYRYGGEEFVIVFGDADAVAGRLLCERVRLAVAGAALTGENLEPIGQVTVSIGVAAYPEHASTLDNLIRLADQAMYEAKQAGRDRVVVARSEAGAKAA